MGEGQGMGETASATSGYMTVGEIAQRAGVTVRSVQYYDQQGILSPSAKGPHNQRLYTSEDLDRLYCVLCLKYAGLSLSQIRQFVAQEPGEKGVDDVFSQAILKTEQDFAELLHRHAVLSGMRQAALDTSRASGAQPDWQVMARSIGAEAPHDADEGRRCVIAAWHEVIAEAVGLMRRREPFDSARSVELARKVVALRKADEGRPAEERFSLLEDMSASFEFAHGEGFGGMRREMNAYLDQLVEACGGDGAAK